MNLNKIFNDNKYLIIILIIIIIYFYYNKNKKVIIKKKNKKIIKEKFFNDSVNIDMNNEIIKLKDTSTLFDDLKNNFKSMNNNKFDLLLSQFISSNDNIHYHFHKNIFTIMFKYELIKNYLRKLNNKYQKLSQKDIQKFLNIFDSIIFGSTTHNNNWNVYKIKIEIVDHNDEKYILISNKDNITYNNDKYDKYLRFIYDYDIAIAKNNQKFLYTNITSILVLGLNRDIILSDYNITDNIIIYQNGKTKTIQIMINESLKNKLNDYSDKLSSIVFNFYFKYKINNNDNNEYVVKNIKIIQKKINSDAYIIVDIPELIFNEYFDYKYFINSFKIELLNYE